MDLTGSALGTIPDDLSANLTVSVVVVKGLPILILIQELDLTNNRLKSIENLSHLTNLKVCRPLYLSSSLEPS